MLTLSTKQRKWLAAYLTFGQPGFLNATEAARRAGYAWPNKVGPRVSHSPKIKPLIDAWFFDSYGHYWTDEGKRCYERPKTGHIMVGKR